LKRIEVEKELKIIEREGVLNVQPLAIRLPTHSSSSSKCVEGKVYNEEIKFAQMIIQNIDITKTFAVEFLRISKQYERARK
jgi:hypothetical protein